MKNIRTVLVFTRLSTLRFFRDRLALFFGILFPLIFLFVFGALSSGEGNISFSVAIINQSKSPVAAQVVQAINKAKVFKVDKTVHTLAAANDKMGKDQLDAAILLPPNFGSLIFSTTQPSGPGVPNGTAQVIYTESNATAGTAITPVLQNVFQAINSHYVATSMPLSVVGKQLQVKSLTSFDYIFSGLLGFSIIGLGIFGPVNVFPELKKQGILRRLHTTPLKVWQYFTATMLSQAIIGLVSIAVQFAVAISVFHLKVDGDFLEIAAYTVLCIFMILGLGLAIGGWAKNERQAAPLSNIIVFPMLFLSGTFFPRFEMPHWLQNVTTYLPLTPVIDGLRMLTTEGKHLTQIGPQLGLVAIWLVIVYAIAFRVFRWE